MNITVILFLNAHKVDFKLIEDSIIVVGLNTKDFTKVFHDAARNEYHLATHLAQTSMQVQVLMSHLNTLVKK